MNYHHLTWWDPGGLGQDLVMEESCRSDLEGRELAEVEQEDSLLQAEDSCTQLVGSRCKLLGMNCHGLEGMVGLEGRGEGMLELMGHQDVEMERLRAEEDKE